VVSARAGKHVASNNINTNKIPITTEFFITPPYISGKSGCGGAFLPPHPVVTVFGTAADTVGQVIAEDAAGAPKPLGVPKPVVGAEPNAVGPVANPVPGVVVLPYAFPPNPPPTKLGWLLTLTCPCPGGT
jgi:hypothetical protein